MELMIFAGAALVKIAMVMIVVLLTVAFLTLAERKVLSWMQDRMGPMEVGPYGILQPIADGLKLFFKEDIIPSGANWLLFSLAPILSVVPALIGFAVIPYGPNLIAFVLERTYKHGEVRFPACAGKCCSEISLGVARVR